MEMSDERTTVHHRERTGRPETAGWEKDGGRRTISPTSQALESGEMGGQMHADATRSD